MIISYLVIFILIVISCYYRYKYKELHKKQINIDLLIQHRDTTYKSFVSYIKLLHNIIYNPLSTFIHNKQIYNFQIKDKGNFAKFRIIEKDEKGKIKRYDEIGKVYYTLDAYQGKKHINKYCDRDNILHHINCNDVTPVNIEYILNKLTDCFSVLNTEKKY